LEDFQEAFTDYAVTMELTEKMTLAALKTLMGKECKQVSNLDQLVVPLLNVS